MAVKRTTKLKKMIVKRTKLIEESTHQLLEELSEVTGGADLFFKETMPQHNIRVEWVDVEISEKDYVLIKGAMVADQYSAANVMVVSVPLEMAAESTAREICDYMMKTSGREKQEAPESLPGPPPIKPAQTEFDLSKLTPQQREALYLFNATRGGKV